MAKWGLRCGSAKLSKCGIVSTEPHSKMRYIIGHLG